MSMSPAILDREYAKFCEVTGETAVRVCGEVSIVAAGGTGNKFLASFAGITVPGVETTGISFTVGISLTRTLQLLNVSCFRPCLIRVKNGSTLLGTGRTGPGAYNLALNISQVGVPSGNTVTVTFEGLSGEKASDIEMFLSGTEV